MRTILLILCTLLAAAQTPAPATPATPADNMDFCAFRNGHWWDGKQFVQRTMYSVKGELHPNPLPVPFKAEQVDLQGGYVIPACAEAHNHAATADHPEATDRFIAAGILYAKNPANIPGVRVGSNVNTPEGVDIIFSNGTFTAPEGHPLVLVKRGGIKVADSEGGFYYTIDSIADLDAKFPRFLATKPDFVKVILVYSEEYEKRKFRPEYGTPAPGSPDWGRNDPYFSRRGLNPAFLKPIVDRARKAGLAVVAHVESAADFHVAVDAGVNEINHMPGFWPTDESIASGDFAKYRIAEADARNAARRGITVVSTLHGALGIVSKMVAAKAAGEKAGTTAGAAGYNEKSKPLLDVYRANIELLRKHGVKLLMGSDEFRKSSRDEVLSLADYHLLSNSELLTSWCELTPQSLFPKRKIGKLRDGFEANFVVLKNDPLADIKAITNVQMVYKHGKRLK
ncbi:MAG TPA: amidohydrolase family protein [Terriglobales bacterium]|nr:amidohydrolase family protein [Terriglobales bacterium]